MMTTLLYYSITVTTLFCWRKLTFRRIFAPYGRKSLNPEICVYPCPFLYSLKNTGAQPVAGMFKRSNVGTQSRGMLQMQNWLELAQQLLSQKISIRFTYRFIALQPVFHLDISITLCKFKYRIRLILYVELSVIPHIFFLKRHTL